MHGVPGPGAARAALHRLRAKCDSELASGLGGALFGSTKEKYRSRHGEACDDLSVVARYINNLEKRLGLEGEAFRHDAGEMQEVTADDIDDLPPVPEDCGCGGGS
jgi:hypothetical protein